MVGSEHALASPSCSVTSHQQAPPTHSAFGERRTRKIDTAAGEDLRLPVERGMAAIFADQHLRQQRRRGQPTGDQPLRSGRLHDRLAGSASYFGLLVLITRSCAFDGTGPARLPVRIVSTAADGPRRRSACSKPRSSASPCLRHGSGKCRAAPCSCLAGTSRLSLRIERPATISLSAPSSQRLTHNWGRRRRRAEVEEALKRKPGLSVRLISGLPFADQVAPRTSRQASQRPAFHDEDGRRHSGFIGAQGAAFRSNEAGLTALRLQVGIHPISAPGSGCLPASRLPRGKRSRWIKSWTGSRISAEWPVLSGRALLHLWRTLPTR